MYTINEFSKLSGVSPRSLRHYEDLGLLNPSREKNGYRIYNNSDVEKLHLILFYKSLGYKLSSIKEIMKSSDFNLEESLIKQLTILEERKEQLESLIDNVNKTLKSIRGEIVMSDIEKFEIFKKNLVEENERNYGEIVRNFYGDDSVNHANNKILNMTEDDYQRIQDLSEELNEKLGNATKIGDPHSVLAKEVVELHKEWLSFFMHHPVCNDTQLSLAKMYVADDRFKKYYENICEGSAEFLLEAVKFHNA